jgi:serine/threonine-protein kinase RsbT
MTGHFTPLPGDPISIRDESDVAMARQRVRAFGLQQAMSVARIAALETAVTEIARNILVHAGSGEMSFAAASSRQRRGIVVVARDWGPGIADIAQAMEDGYSTGSGLGMGLAGAQRLVDEFEIESAAGTGVKVTLTQWSDDEP